MAADSGAERHILAGKDFGHATKRTRLPKPIILETANGETQVTEHCQVCCAGLYLDDVLLCKEATTSLLSTDTLAEQNWEFRQRRGGSVLTTQKPFTFPWGCPSKRRSGR